MQRLTAAPKNRAPNFGSTRLVLCAGHLLLAMQCYQLVGPLVHRPDLHPAELVFGKVDRLEKPSLPPLHPNSHLQP